uniref:Uncharacterized protein n=1 Tax=Parastrongyloides trichosuri TaxID=131310 RepID=A0A0N4ZYW3_PARTI
MELYHLKMFVCFIYQIIIVVITISLIIFTCVKKKLKSDTVSILLLDKNGKVINKVISRKSAFNEKKTTENLNENKTTINVSKNVQQICKPLEENKKCCNLKKQENAELPKDVKLITKSKNSSKEKKSRDNMDKSNKNRKNISKDNIIFRTAKQKERSRKSNRKSKKNVIEYQVEMTQKSLFDENVKDSSFRNVKELQSEAKKEFDPNILVDDNNNKNDAIKIKEGIDIWACPSESAVQKEN